MLFVLVACDPQTEGSSQSDVETINGEAQGTTYNIRYLSSDSVAISKSAIDSILDVIDLSLSTWVENSTISSFNSNDSIVITDPHFITIFERGRELSALTGGAFNPMVAPLVKAWGFGPEGGRVKNDLNVDSLRELVSFDIEIEAADHKGLRFRKKPGMEIDVNSYAQGYAVDVMADYLSAMGVSNMMVELGGEVVARGVNEKGSPWRIGIDKPLDNMATRELQAAVALEDAALATSGTYRKFYEQDGKKYSHTIDPKTGYPVDHNLLSVTVMAPNCTNADAMATAFLVMGVEETKKFLDQHPELQLEVYLIYDDGGETLASFSSQGWKKQIEEF